MAEVQVRERMKGFVSISAHPTGCFHQVDDVIGRVEEHDFDAPGSGPVVVIGASGGYGLPAAVVSLFGLRRPVIAVSFDRAPEGNRTGTAGWYNTIQLGRRAAMAGVSFTSLNGDAFSDDMKDEVIDALRPLGPPSLLIYSLASPVRTDPVTGETHRSVLKPIGERFETKTVRIDTGEVRDTVLEPASDDEITATIKVMGGEDWHRWIDALDTADLIGGEFRTVAFDYVGPEVTHPIYRSGTIGQAKAHLEETGRQLNERLGPDGGAWTSVNAAAVTQSSAAIPAVPLYLSLLLEVAGAAGTFEDPTRQIIRLFSEHLGPQGPSDLDGTGRIRLDRWELADDVQAEVSRRWDIVDTDTLEAHGDFQGFRDRFRGLFGFGLPTIDYVAPVEIDPDLITSA